MNSDYRFLFPETWNLRKVTSVGSNFLSPASLDINSPFCFKYFVDDSTFYITFGFLL